MKRNLHRPVKKSAKRPLEFRKIAKIESPSNQRHSKPRLKYSPQIGLPPNEKLRKFADEIYGAMELPSGSRKK